MNSSKAQLILRNGQFTTLDRQNPQATAVAISDGRFIAAGNDDEVMRLADSNTQVIDLNRHRVIPGLIDSHLHLIRGGRTQLQPGITLGRRSLAG